LLSAVNRFGSLAISVLQDRRDRLERVDHLSVSAAVRESLQIEGQQVALAPHVQIQAPGGRVSTSFMAFGNGEDWSTWLLLGESALQQRVFLELCLFNKLKQWVDRRSRADPSSLLSG
jgi:hypothetical protein